MVVKDKETVVIGGLIDDSTSVDNQPGSLVWGTFRFWDGCSRRGRRGGTRRNLFIFITPHIVRNQAEAAAIYQKKLDDVGNVEEGVIKMNEKRDLPEAADRPEGVKGR